MADDLGSADKLVRLGRIAGPHGVRGWIKVRSDTEPPEAILQYQPWLVGPDRREMRVADVAPKGRSLRIALEGIDDRNAAEALVGADIAVPRDRLPPLPQDRYYWADLVGCTVVTADERVLGEVVEMIETGANDVMRVRGDRERLVPFVPEIYVSSVDLEARRVEVNWDPEF
ncbi:ribosome maturation factor RimM [Elongatibacter sediminis]|uniref:Ribosome maturation factor RimM n=1 Tax=Elongatibacter sediminis TaxID=3119006 RepID=A0AAW9RHL5_9GAMM